MVEKKYVIVKSRMDLEGDTALIETEDEVFLDPSGEPFFGSWTDNVDEFEKDDSIQLLVREQSDIEECSEFLHEHRTLFLSESAWRKVERETRKALLKHYTKSFFVKRYIANIINDLRFADDEDEVKELLCEALYQILY